jgi:hypothetical protein
VNKPGYKPMKKPGNLKKQHRLLYNYNLTSATMATIIIISLTLLKMAQVVCRG